VFAGVGQVVLTVRLDREVVELLHEIKMRDGAPLNEQVRRAIQLWLVHKGLVPEKALSTRKPRRGEK
jgi:hypothetical protein